MGTTNKCENGQCENDTTKICEGDKDCIVIKKSDGGKVMYKKDMSHIRHLSDLLSNWKYDIAKKYFDDVYSIYGFPYMAINKEDGLCVWKKNTIPNNDIHYKIVLRDEAIKHSLPKPHIDYLYSHIKMYIPPDKLNLVQTISGSIGYDPLKKEVFARCGSFSANYATIRTIFDVLNNKKTDYKINIGNMRKDHNSNLDYIKKELKINYEKYKKEMNLDCYPGAFPNSCR